MSSLALYTLAVLCWGVFSCGCKRGVTYESRSLDEIRTNAGFSGKVEVILIHHWGSEIPQEVRIGIVLPGGGRLMIGDSNVSDDFLVFAKSLREGEHYNFPDILASFEKNVGRRLEEPRKRTTRETVTIRGRNISITELP